MVHKPREFLRFPPDDGIVAWIDPRVRDTRDAFVPKRAALVTDEALVGCGLVVLGEPWMREGAQFVTRVGKLAPLRAEIRWIHALGEGVLKLGVEFLE